MPFFRSRPICVTCDRHLPRAASRCPWCKKPVLVIAASSGSGAARGRPVRGPASSLLCEGGGQ